MCVRFRRKATGKVSSPTLRVPFQPFPFQPLRLGGLDSRRGDMVGLFRLTVPTPTRHWYSLSSTEIRSLGGALNSTRCNGQIQRKRGSRRPAISGYRILVNAYQGGVRANKLTATQDSQALSFRPASNQGDPAFRSSVRRLRALQETRRSAHPKFAADADL